MSNARLHRDELARLWAGHFACSCNFVALKSSVNDCTTAIVETDQCGPPFRILIARHEILDADDDRDKIHISDRVIPVEIDMLSCSQLSANVLVSFKSIDYLQIQALSSDHECRSRSVYTSGRRWEIAQSTLLDRFDIRSHGSRCPYDAAHIDV